MTAEYQVRRDRVVEDCVQLIDEEVGRKSGYGSSLAWSKLRVCMSIASETNITPLR